MKIAIAGKGGVGKTFISGTLSRLFANDGFKVLAIDADPAMNLSYALGIPSDTSSKVRPIAENKELIEQRVGKGPIYNIAPTVHDITENFGIVGPEGVMLLIMGTIRTGGSGCMCPANSLIRALIRHITLERKDIVIMDMEAGLEHLGRATIKGFDILLCVVEPGAQSIETAKKIKKLSNDIGIQKIMAIGNKIIQKEDIDFLKKSLNEVGLGLIHTIPFDQNVIKADSKAIAPLDLSPNSPAVKAIEELKETLTMMTR